MSALRVLVGCKRVIDYAVKVRYCHPIGNIHSSLNSQDNFLQNMLKNM